MFGWRKKQADGRQINERNPLCAKAFHPLYDKYLTKQDGEEFIFKTSFWPQFETEYSLAQLARQRYTLDEYRKSFLDTTTSMLSQYMVKSMMSVQADPGNAELATSLGRGAALTTVGRIIFAHAPGFANGGPAEAHKLSILMVQDLRHALENSLSIIPNPYSLGAFQACCGFLTAVHQ